MSIVEKKLQEEFLRIKNMGELDGDSEIEVNYNDLEIVNDVLKCGKECGVKEVFFTEVIKKIEDYINRNGPNNKKDESLMIKCNLYAYVLGISQGICSKEPSIAKRISKNMVRGSSHRRNPKDLMVDL